MISQARARYATNNYYTQMPIFKRKDQPENDPNVAPVQSAQLVAQSVVQKEPEKLSPYHSLVKEVGERFVLNGGSESWYSNRVVDLKNLVVMPEKTKVIQDGKPAYIYTNGAPGYHREKISKIVEKNPLEYELRVVNEKGDKRIYKLMALKGNDIKSPDYLAFYKEDCLPKISGTRNIAMFYVNAPAEERRRRLQDWVRLQRVRNREEEEDPNRPPDAFEIFMAENAHVLKDIEEDKRKQREFEKKYRKKLQLQAEKEALAKQKLMEKYLPAKDEKKRERSKSHKHRRHH